MLKGTPRPWTNKTSECNNNVTLTSYNNTNLTVYVHKFTGSIEPFVNREGTVGYSFLSEKKTNWTNAKKNCTLQFLQFCCKFVYNSHRRLSSPVMKYKLYLPGKLKAVFPCKSRVTTPPCSTHSI